MNHVIINGHRVEKIEYKDQPVITLNMIDELHERPNDTARRNFNHNKNRLVEYEDFFRVPYDEWTQVLVGRNSSDQKGGHHGNMIFITQSGYLMLVKSFNDDLAWKVQRELVKRYFVVEQIKDGLGADVLSMLNHKGMKLNQRLKIMNLSRQMSEMDNIGRAEMVKTYNILCGLFTSELNERKKTNRDFTLEKGGFYDFLDERCVVNPKLTIGKQDLYNAYESFAVERECFEISYNNFFKHLYKTVDISSYRPRVQGGRSWCLRGIGLNYEMAAVAARY